MLKYANSQSLSIFIMQVLFFTMCQWPISGLLCQKTMSDLSIVNLLVSGYTITMMYKRVKHVCGKRDNDVIDNALQGTISEHLLPSSELAEAGIFLIENYAGIVGIVRRK